MPFRHRTNLGPVLPRDYGRAWRAQGEECGLPDGWTEGMPVSAPEQSDDWLADAFTQDPDAPTGSGRFTTRGT